jgi:hypothetical protein
LGYVWGREKAYRAWLAERERELAEFILLKSWSVVIREEG